MSPNRYGNELPLGNSNTERYFGRFAHAAARCKSIFDYAELAAEVVEQ